MTNRREKVRRKLCELLGCGEAQRVDTDDSDDDSDKPWALVLDKLYEMGGYGEYPKFDPRTVPIHESVDLLSRLDVDIRTIEKGATHLNDRGLANLEKDEEKSKISLETEGFTLAHDREQARRNREQQRQNRASNRAVVLLTFVLAFVGIAQATALTARAAQLTMSVPDAMMGEISVVMTTGAFFVLLVIHLVLLRAGVLTASDLEP